MDGVVEIEDDDEISNALDPTDSKNGIFFYKLLTAFGLLCIYLFISKFGGYLASRFARLVNNDNQENHDEAMQAARRKLQERFDEELRKRQLQSKSKGKESMPISSEKKSTINPKQSESQVKRVKAPKPEQLNDSGFFPLMGDTSHRVCYRSARGARSGGG